MNNLKDEQLAKQTEVRSKKNKGEKADSDIPGFWWIPLDPGIQWDSMGSHEIHWDFEISESAFPPLEKNKSSFIDLINFIGRRKSFKRISCTRNAWKTINWIKWRFTNIRKW